MGVIEDLLDAIDEYPAHHVQFGAPNIVVEPPGAQGAFNTGDTLAFTIDVTNDGHLDLINLVIHVRASQFVSIRRAGSTSFGNVAFSSAIDVPAMANIFFPTFRVFGPFEVRADAVTGGQVEDLVSFHVSTFDAGFDHILNDHGHHSDEPTGALSLEIHPS